MQSQLIKKHHERFNSSHEVTCFFSPGRVNLIGEHIDYNGGNVLPLALSIGNYGTFQFRDDRLIALYSDSFSEMGVLEVSLDDLSYQKSHDWANYAKGVILELIQRGFEIDKGFNISITSTLPSGAGLSSSASIEALIAVMMNDMFHLQLDRTYLSVLTQKVENEYIHVNCGIMDQFVILNGEDESAILLDTSTLKFEVLPLKLQDTSIVIVNSKKKRGLVDSKYNERRNECEQALSFYQKHLSVDSLCQINVDEMIQYKEGLNDILYKRARHAITEQDRVLKTKEALINNNLPLVGQYLIESHLSLRDDYEVSVKEVDLLVDLSLKYKALGARMTGAGFGGCTVNLVYQKDVDQFIKNVGEDYEKATGLKAEFYIAKASNKTSKCGL